MRETLQKIALAAFVCALLILGCTKTTQPSPTSKSWVKSPRPMESYLHNEENQEDDNMQKTLYKFSQAFKEVVKSDPALRRMVVEMARQNAYGEVKYEELIKTSSKFAEVLPKYFNVGSRTSNLDSLFQELISTMTYLNVDYYPSLVIPNIENITEYSPAVVAVGMGTEAEGYGDNEIPGQLVEDDNHITDIFVGEHDAYAATYPIFIITTATDAVDPEAEDENRIVEPNQTNSQNRTEEVNSNVQMRWSAYQIKNGYHYEANGDIDLYHMVVVHKFNFATSEAINPFGGVEARIDDHIKRADVNNSKIFSGTLKLIDILGSIPSTTATASPHASMSTFEFDWYTSRKPIGCFAQATSNAKVKMTYANEWYMQDIGDCHYLYADPSNQPIGTDVGFSNNKSMFKIRRIQ